MTRKKSKSQKRRAKHRKAKKIDSAIKNLMNLKVSDKDKRVLRTQAKRYMEGNLSEWLRFAGKYFKPSKHRLSTR